MKKLLTIFIASSLFWGCEDVSDRAFDRVASPVLGQISLEKNDTEISGEAFFAELDKSGILDQAIGIDTIPLPGLSILISTAEGSELETISTGADGTFTFQLTSEAEQLEFSGTHEGQDFRFIRKL
jgi:hypothetical protein